MRNTRQDQAGFKKAQTAIEYLLLLTICALIAFVFLRTFFVPGGKVKESLDLYFCKIKDKVAGSAPNIP